MWIRVFNITWIQTETGNTSLLVTTAASKIIAKSSVVYILSLTWSPQVLCSEVHSLLSPPEMMYLTEAAWLWAQMREELRSALQEDLKWLVISYKPSPFFLWRDWRENSTFQAINLLLSRRKRQVTSRTWVSNSIAGVGSVVTPMCPEHVGYPRNPSKACRHDTGSTEDLPEKQQKARRVSGYPGLLKWQNTPTRRYLNPAQHCSKQYSLTVAGTFYGWWWNGLWCHSLTALLSMLGHFPNGKRIPGGRTL